MAGMHMPPVHTPTLLLFLKAGDVKIAGQAGYAFYGGRWHKVGADKPAPKGAPLAAHPKAGGDHAPAQHFTAEQWAALQLPAANVNAGSFNAALAKLKEWSEAGNVTAILGAGYGTNTYGKKLAAVANHLLGLHGNAHKVEAGQKAGTHGAVLSGPAEPHPTGLPQHLAPKSAFNAGQKIVVSADVQHEAAGQTGEIVEVKAYGVGNVHYKVKLDGGATEMFQEGELERPGKNASAPEMPVGQVDGPLKGTHIGGKLEASSDEKLKDLAANHPWPKVKEHAQAVLDAKAPAPPPEPVPAPPPAAAGALTMPAFAEGAKAGHAVTAFYEKIAQKVIDHGHAGNVAVLQDMPDPTKGNAWKGKTQNSKLLLALHAQALAHAQGGAEPAAAPFGVKSTKKGNLLSEGGVHKLSAKDFSGVEQALGMSPGSLKDTDSTTYTVTDHQGRTFSVYKHGGALSVRTSGKNKDQASAQELLEHLKSAVDAGPKEGDTKPAADGGTLVLKDGHWVKQGDDAAASGAKNFEFDTGDVFKLNSQFDKMNAGEWVVYNISADGTLVHMHKVGATAPNKDNTVAIPAFVFAAAIEKGTAKKQPAAAAPQQVAPAAAGAITADQLGKLQSIPWYKLKLPDTNSNAASVNKKLQALQDAAFAGDVAAIEGMKFGSNTYGKKLALAAQTAVAALKEGGAPVAAPAAAADDKVTELTPKQIGGLKVWLASGQPTSKHPDSWSNLWKKLSPAMKAAVKGDAAPDGLAGKPAYDHFAQAKSATGGVPVKAINDWMAANPGKDDELAEALASLGQASMAASPGQKTEPATLTDGWKQAIVAGKVPTKEQAEHMDAMEQAYPDAYMDAFMDAVNGSIPANQLADDKFDEAMDVAHSKAHKLHAAALSGDAMPGLSPGQMEAVDALAAMSDVAGLQVIVNSGVSDAIKAYAQKLIDRLGKTAAAPPQSRIKKVSATLLHNTSEGHNKFWAASLSPDGLSMLTTYGKIGSKGQKTTKTFATQAQAGAAINKLIQEKKDKGYKYKGQTDHFHEVTSATQPSGPQEGDTKQGADGMLVLKDGHWVKVDQPIKKLTHAQIAEAIESVSPGKAAFSSNVPGKLAMKAALSGDGAAMLPAYHQAVTSGYPKTASHIKAVASAMGVDTSDWKDGTTLPPAAAPAPVADPAPVASIPSMDDWPQTGKQLGSNPGGRFKDPATGTEYYVKYPATEDIARSEVLAAKLYGLAGLGAQDAMLVRKAGKVSIASRWVDVKKAGTPEALAATKEAQAGFAVDAWLANWDVVGLGFDNLQVGPDGKAIRIDAGGSLEYRAQGAKKPFGPKVDEIDTLRDAKTNPQAAAVFGKMTEADLNASVARVLAVEDSQIRALVNEHGPGTEADRKAMADTLIARKADLAARFPKAGKAPKKVLDPSKLPIDPKSIPKVHDFENWNGPGKGLSSKDFVNKSNVVIEEQMRSLAQIGNLTALKSFKFDEVNKETGVPTGKKIDVEKHPSKHVQQYHQDLLQILDEVANPPEPLKVFSDTDVGSLAALNAAFPPKKFGTTVGKVQSNEKLGFWVALGSVGNPAKFRPKSVSNYTTMAISAAKTKYLSASKLAKHFISSVQASGSYNDLFRDGKTEDYAGNSLKDVAKAALAHATEMPEGTSIYRWQKMSPQMLAHVMSAKDGTVFQATGPMCTSYDPTATKGFGTHRVTVRYAKGAKAVESFGSGGFAGEKEVTTLPNSRFVILSKKMVPDVEHGNPNSQRLELEILMLPPDLGI